ncbi:MAG: GtrA family protein [Candidatus Magasanikbacteria bacterium]
MLRKLLSYFWRVRFEFTKYFVIGFSGMFLDIATLVLFKEVFGVWATLAVILNQIIVVAYNFTLNKYWSFKNKALPHKQFVRYMLVFGVNYLIAIGAMFVFSDKVGFDYRLVRIFTIALSVSWNFLIYKYWVYKNT